MSVPCGDDSNITSLIETVSQQLSLHLSTLCSDILDCSSAMAAHNCLPNNSRSAVALSYDASISMTGRDAESELFLEVYCQYGRSFVTHFRFFEIYWFNHRLNLVLLAD